MMDAERAPHPVLVENFISDCLLPSTAKTDRKSGTELFYLFDQYCGALEIDNPLDIRVFGRMMGKHFNKVNCSGRNKWCVKYKPGVVEG